MIPPTSPLTRRVVIPEGDPRCRQAVGIVERLRDQGFESYLVGGCVRDLALGREPKDYDIATAARPGEVERIFRRTVAVGKAFGVVQVLLGGCAYEVATFRRDLEYDDGRRPRGVAYCSAREDVLRRDFTVNGLLMDPRPSGSGPVLIDWAEGLRDLEARRLRAIGRAADRFAEDHLRILRAVRFAAELDFEIDADTWSAVVAGAESLRRISRERVRDEMLRVFACPGFLRGLDLVVEAGLTAPALPLLASRIEAASWGTLRARAEALRTSGDAVALTRLACVLLPEAAPSGVDPVLATIPELERALPEEHGALLDLRLSREQSRHVLGAMGAAHGAFRLLSDEAQRDAQPRPWPRHLWLRMLRRPGAAAGLAIAEARAECEALESREAMARQRRWADSLAPEDLHPPRLVDGRDLMAAGLPRGPALGRILRRVEDAQLDGLLTDREAALALALEEAREEGSTGGLP